MVANQRSISIDTNQEIEIRRYMVFMGIKSFSGGVHSLIHRGLNYNGSNRNKGGGVPINEDVSNGDSITIEYSENNPPSCFGIPGTGDCERPCSLKLACAINYSNSFNKTGE